MKYARVQFSLVALLFAAVAPCAMASHKADPAVTLKAPQLVAGFLPVPWPKRPALTAETPYVMADFLPVSWPKRPGSPPSGINITSPQLVAGVLPVPWPKRPGSPA